MLKRVMRFQFRFVFAIFCFTAILILAVYLRSANNRVFYKLWADGVKQDRLERELREKQLRVEQLINPTAVLQRIEEE